MNKNVLGILITVVAVLAVGGVVIANKKDEDSKDVSSMSHSDGSTKPVDGNVFTNPGKDQSTNQVQSGEVKMNIAGFAFAQKIVKIKKGTKITWTNQDSARHDVSPDSKSPDFMNSELLSKGESYSYTFNTAGKYTYHCTPHPYMKASVEVTE